MMNVHRFVSGPALVSGLLATALIGLTGCGGGSKGDPDNRGEFKVNLISTGQGQIYPYRIREVDSQGSPTNQITNPEVIATSAHVSPSSATVLAATWPSIVVVPTLT